GEEDGDGNADRLLLAMQREGADRIGLTFAAGDERALAGALQAGEGERGLGEAIDLEELVPEVLVAQREPGGEAGERDADLPGSLGPGGLVEVGLAREAPASPLARV